MIDGHAGNDNKSAPYAYLITFNMQTCTATYGSTACRRLDTRLYGAQQWEQKSGLALDTDRTSNKCYHLLTGTGRGNYIGS